MNALTPPGHDTLNYQACQYGGARIAFRGPAKQLRGDYVAFLGGTETFGSFIETPFVDLTELQTGLTCVNLGCRRGGIDSYISGPGLLHLCSTAAATVIQIMGAQNMSNRFYTVDPRRNNRFMRASKAMKAIFHDIDFTSIETTDDLLLTLAREAPDRMHLLREEIQTAWTARMHTLIHAIEGPVILLWAADHAPYSASFGGTICREPMFVDRAMLDEVMNSADHLIEVIASPDEVTTGLARMRVGPADMAAAVEMLGPVLHRRIAATLSPLLESIVGLPELEEVNFFHRATKD